MKSILIVLRGFRVIPFATGFCVTHFYVALEEQS